MKKRFAAVLLIAVVAVSSLAAVDISLAVGGQGTFGELTVGKNTSYKVSVDAELDMDFATSITTVPYHPGAAKYFAEKGYTVPVK